MDKQRIGAFAEAVYRDMAGPIAIYASSRGISCSHDSRWAGSNSRRSVLTSSCNSFLNTVVALGHNSRDHSKAQRTDPATTGRHTNSRRNSVCAHRAGTDNVDHDTHDDNRVGVRRHDHIRDDRRPCAPPSGQAGRFQRSGWHRLQCSGEASSPKLALKAPAKPRRPSSMQHQVPMQMNILSWSSSLFDLHPLHIVIKLVFCRCHNIDFSQPPTTGICV